MSKFRIISDLHLEFYKNIKKIERVIQKIKNDKDIDYLILSGDIVTLDSISFLNTFIENNYKNIFYILGNHELYKNKIPENKIKYDDAIKHYRNYVKNLNSNIVFLENDIYTTKENIKIAGCTLWSDIDDYSYSKLSDKFFISQEECVNAHKNSENFLKKAIDENVDIIMTHHLPSYKLVSEKYKDSQINSGFYSNLDHVFNGYNGYWICGHTHEPFEKVIKDTKFICNPLGYPSGNMILDKFITI